MRTPIRKLFPLNLKSLVQYNNKTIKLNTYETNKNYKKWSSTL